MSPIPGPIIVLVLPVLAATVVYLVRRWALPATLVSTLLAGGVSILCLRLPLDRSAFVLGQEVAFGRPIVVLGQTLALDPAAQTWLAFVFALATILYVFAWRISQGRSFYSFSLLILSLYALIALLDNFSLSILVLAISTTLMVFIIQAGQTASVRGAQRYLLVTLLAVPFLLAATWLLNQPSPDVTRLALLPAALGFGLLLAVFPFGTWMPALAADAPPLVSAFVFTASQAMALLLTLIFLRDHPFLVNAPVTRAAIQLAGLTMAASGGAMAAVQRDFGRLLGYAALSDLGVLLLALGTSSSQSVALVLLHVVSRSASITLMAAALAILRHRATTDRFAELGGVARRLPLTTTALILGGLALAGFPFTAGFPTHWAVSRSVWTWTHTLSFLKPEATLATNPSSIGQWASTLALLAILASSAGIIIGLLRGLSAMLGSDDREDVVRQPILASMMVLALAALVIVLGLYPQLFLGLVQSAAQAFSLF